MIPSDATPDGIKKPPKSPPQKRTAGYIFKTILYWTLTIFSIVTSIALAIAFLVDWLA